MAEIIYSPQIYLFAFHLFKTPNARNRKDLNKELLWDKCHNLIFKKFYINEKLDLKDNKSNHKKFNLLNSSDINLPIKTTIHHENEAFELEGVVYPLQLYDSYGLGFSLGFPDPEPQKLQATRIKTKVSILEKFNPNYCLLPDYIESNLGQTLIITAWLDEEQQQLDQKSLKDLADECLAKFVVLPPEQRPLFNQEGELFGSPIFEYGVIQSKEVYRHILVWFFKDTQTFDSFGQCYDLLLDLFFYRNKVISEFQNSRYTYDIIYKKYEDIEQSVGKIFQDLSPGNFLSIEDLKSLKIALKKLIEESVEYAVILGDLKLRLNNTVIHTGNYKTTLKFIRKDLKLTKEEDLVFLEQFSNEYCRTFQEQIQADLSFFVQGSSLLETAIESIRGIVEIDQAERDREREENEKKREREQVQRDREREENEKLREREQAQRDRKREENEKLRERQLQMSIFAAGSAVTVGGIIASSSGQVPSKYPLKSPLDKTATSIHPFTWFVLGSIVSAFFSGWVAWNLVKSIQKRSENRIKSSEKKVIIFARSLLLQIGLYRLVSFLLPKDQSTLDEN